MNEIQKEYLRLVAAYEEKVFGFSEKIKFRDWLLDIIKNHHTALTTDNVRDAKNLLDRIQREIDHY